MNEELRPCPFCGRLFDLDQQYTGEEIRCPNCICTLVEKYDEELHQLKERWNSAWCWKEIDRLKEELEQEKQKYQNALNVIDSHSNAIKQLKAENEKMREALNLISAFCGRPIEFEETPSNNGEVARLLRDILREAVKAMKEE